MNEVPGTLRGLWKAVCRILAEWWVVKVEMGQRGPFLREREAAIRKR